mmetsp:Transcript_95745/g.157983  ORF Transcript_95745/g.157983 Transcript_95745/m.157983 type:complete len:164 (-) Transcript_95745:8-499(-)
MRVRLQNILETSHVASSFVAFNQAEHGHLPKGNCPIFRPPLLPEASCKDHIEEDPKKPGVFGCKPEPPSCCEAGRRAEAAVKRVEDAINKSFLMQLFSVNMDDLMTEVQKDMTDEKLKQETMHWVLGLLGPPPLLVTSAPGPEAGPLALEDLRPSPSCLGDFL